MGPQDLKDLLQKAFKAPERMTAWMLQGGPGVGKTAIPTQAAQQANKRVITVALPTCEAVDVRGLPAVINGQTVWNSPFPRDGEGILILDEISSAAPDVQVAAHHLVWAEAGSDMSLPLGWHIVLTGNRAVDKTVYRAMSGPLRNRVTLLTVTTDVAQWAPWAMDAGVDGAIIGFLRWRPELLVAREIPSEGAFVSPRAWHRASSLLHMSVSASIEKELLIGTLGEGATVEFSAYLRTVRELPSIEDILRFPDKADVPSSPSLLYALTTNLAQYTRQTQKSAMAYIQRLPAEFGLLWIRDVRDFFDIRNDKDSRSWVRDHKSMFKDSL
jgi:hypothetical protein